MATSVRLAPEVESGSCVAVRLLPAISDEYPHGAALAVIVPSAWLLRVPYLRNRLMSSRKRTRTPESQSVNSKVGFLAAQRTIAVHCAVGTSPPSYVKCLKLLTAVTTTTSSLPAQPDQGYSRSLAAGWRILGLGSVSAALELAPVARHLLWQECWDTCMEFLAAVPWSCQEEDSIVATISALSSSTVTTAAGPAFKPSKDVLRRLDTSHDTASLESMLSHMLCSLDDASFRCLGLKVLEISSAPIKQAFFGTLLKLAADMVARHLDRRPYCLPPQWFRAVKFLLSIEDAQQAAVKHIVSATRILFFLSTNSLTAKAEAGAFILKEAGMKVLAREVHLNMDERAQLARYLRYAHKNRQMTKPDDSSDLNELSDKLVETVAVDHVVCRQMLKADMPAWAESWFHRLLHRVQRCSTAAADVGEDSESSE